MTIGVVGTPCHAPTYATLAQGFFKDEGLDATVVQLGSNGTIPAVSAGGVDVGLGVILGSNLFNLAVLLAACTDDKVTKLPALYDRTLTTPEDTAVVVEVTITL